MQDRIKRKDCLNSKHKLEGFHAMHCRQYICHNPDQSGSAVIRFIINRLKIQRHHFSTCRANRETDLRRGLGRGLRSLSAF